MALKKSFETPTGNVIEYWKIELMNYRRGMVEVAGYKDQAARTANKAPALVKTFMIAPDDRASAYAALKALAFFEGAEDV